MPEEWLSRNIIRFDSSFDSASVLLKRIHAITGLSPRRKFSTLARIKTKTQSGVYFRYVRLHDISDTGVCFFARFPFYTKKGKPYPFQRT